MVVGGGELRWVIVDVGVVVSGGRRVIVGDLVGCGGHGADGGDDG